MSTNIEWARNPDGSKGETWPVVTGCTPCSIGCTNCYAARMAATRLKHHPRYEGLATIENGKARWTGKINFNYDVLEQPLHWKKPRRVFVASMGDLFHPSVPSDYIYKVFGVMALSSQHTFQVLTKRPQRMFDVLSHYARAEIHRANLLGHDPINISTWPLSNVHLGVSVENQAAADDRREYLRQCPAAVKFVSYEPALGPVDWTGWEFVSQIISGGESGPGARPSHPDWHRATRDFCQANKIAYFFKSWGAWAPESHWKDFSMAQRNRKGAIFSFGDKRFPQDQRMYKVGKKTAGHLLDGRAWQQFPAADGAGTVQVGTKERRERRHSGKICIRRA